MEAKVVWKNNMLFSGQSGEHAVAVDSKPPLGKNEGFTPKELVAIGLCGCTAMDVIALMKKYKQSVSQFEVAVSISSTQSHPVTFDKIEMTFNVSGEVLAEKYIEAVTLSQTKYCGVSAMIAESADINYKLILNGQEIHQGQAQF